MALPAILKRFCGAPVIVVGDVMLDEYIWGEVERISPEAPVPVVHIENRTHRLGGAANVAANIRALGGACLTIGLIGTDAAGRDLRLAFEGADLPTRGLLKSGAMQTTHKVRVMAQHQQLLRVDFEDSGDANTDMREALVRRVRREIRGNGVLVFSDYGKGVITPDLIMDLLPLCRRRNVRVVVDPKVEHLPLYEGVDVITPNHHEAGAACGVKIVDEETLHVVGQRLLDITNCEAVLITRGPDGMSLFGRGARPIHIPTEAREVFDVSGAGDTVVATLALALAAGEALERAARLANRAAGIIVGKLGVATLTPDELAASLRARAMAKSR